MWIDIIFVENFFKCHPSKKKCDCISYLTNDMSHVPWGCHGRDRIVGFTTTYAISAYHH
jgi:hypothetical protein